MYSQEKLLLQIEPIVRQAGDILLSYFGGKLERKMKDGNSWVTQADLESEKFLISEIGKAFPGTAFFAEESGVSGQGDYCWVIDPLDGTTNFVQGLPYFCISVALTYQNKPIFGVVYRPLLNEFFHAYQGQGAYLNDVRIHIKQQELDKSVLVVGLPYAKTKRYSKIVDSLGAIAPHAYAFRHFGAAALDLAYVARGSLDGVFLIDLGWWDVAAGMILIQEAGGFVTDFTGKPVNQDFTTFVAGGQKIHAQLIGLLKDSFCI